MNASGFNPIAEQFVKPREAVFGLDDKSVEANEFDDLVIFKMCCGIPVRFPRVFAPA